MLVAPIPRLRDTAGGVPPNPTWIPTGDTLDDAADARWPRRPASSRSGVQANCVDGSRPGGGRRPRWRLLFDKELAVTYATINAVVLHGIPGSDGWLPTRVLDGMLGVAAALVVTFGVAPSRLHRQLANRLRRVAARAADGLELAGEALRSDAEERRPGVVRAASARIDHELQRVSGTVEHALDLARWAPIRRRNADDVERLVGSTSALLDALTTASTIVRLAHRALVNDAAVGDPLVNGVGRAATAIRTLVDDIIAECRPDDDMADTCRSAVEALLSEPADRAVVIAIQEEVRGLLDDLIDIADDLTDGSDHLIDTMSTSEATVDGIRFGGAARP